MWLRVMVRLACRPARWWLLRIPESSGYIRFSAVFRLFELVRHPVRALRAPAIGAIGGDVVAILDNHQLNRSFSLAREPLGILGGYDAVKPPVHDEQRAG